MLNGLKLGFRWGFRDEMRDMVTTFDSDTSRYMLTVDDLPDYGA